MKQVYFKDFYFKSLFLLLVFFGIATPNLVKAQAISNTGTVPTLDVCFESGTFTVSIVKGTEARSGATFTITMPAGFKYVSGETYIVGEATALTEASVSTDGQIAKFTLDIPASTSSGDAIDIEFQGIATCGAITGSVAGDTPEVQYMLHLLGETNPISTVISEGMNIQWAVLNLTGVSSRPAAGIGQNVTRTITLKNSGTGSINEFTFEVNRGDGLDFVSLTFPSGWVGSETSPGVYSVVAEGSTVLATDEELIITEVVTVNNCEVTDLTTTYEAYYGCDAKCDINDVNATLSMGLLYELAGAPNITNTTTGLPDITCLGAPYTYTVGYKNTGSATAIDAGMRIHVSNQNTGYNIAGVAGYIVNGSAQYRISLDDGATWETWSTAPVIPGVGENHSKPEFGFTDQVAWQEVGIPDLPPGAMVEVRYDVFHAMPDPAQCAALGSSVYVPATNTRVFYKNAAECPSPTTATYTGFRGIQSSVNYQFNPVHQGEVDVVGGQPYQINAQLGLVIGSSAILPVEDNGYFDLFVTLPSSLTPVSENNSDIYINNFGNIVHFDLIEQVGVRQYRLRINKNSTIWPAGAAQGLDLSLANLVFNTNAVCDGTPFSYTIGGELVRDPVNCPTPFTLKCTTVNNLNSLCSTPGPGDCIGIEKGRPFLQRVNYGFLSTYVNGLPDDMTSPTPMTLEEAKIAGANVRAFVGEELVELGHDGIVSGGPANRTWTTGTVTFNTPSGMSFKAQYGKLILVRGGADTYTADLVNRVTTAGNTVSFDFEALDLRDATGNPVPADFEFEDGDRITASVVVKTDGFPALSQIGLKVFPADIYLTEAGSSVEFNCGFDYTTTGIYVHLAKYLPALSGDPVNITSDCDNLPISYVVGLRINNTYNDPVFYNEYRSFADFDKTTITIPNGLELIGVRVNGVLRPNSSAMTSTTHAAARFDIPTGPVTGSYEFDLASHVATISNAHTSGSGAFSKEGGFYANVAPIFRPICDVGSTVNSGAVLISSTLTPGIFFEGTPGSPIVTNQGSRIINYQNNTLTFSTNSKQGVVLNDEVTWTVRVANSSGSRAYTNMWLGIDDANIKVISVVRIASNGAETPVTVVDGIAQLGTYAAGASYDYRIVAELIDCESGSVNLIWGSGCSAYPTTLATASCIRGGFEGLTFSAPNPQIQSTLITQPAGQHDICDPMSFGVRLRNSGNGIAENLTVTMPKTSLNFVDGSFYVTYPYTNPGSGTRTQIVDLQYIDESPTHIRFILPDTYKLSAGEQLLVEFQVQADPCGFVSGQRYSFTPTATNTCGDMLTTLQTAISNRINISGTPLDEPTLTIESSVAGVTIMPEAHVNVVEATYTFKLTNTGVHNTDDTYNIKVTLPEHWELSDVNFVSNPVGATITPSFSGGVYTFDGWTAGLLTGQNIEFTAKLSLPAGQVALIDCEETIEIYESAGTSIDLGAGCSIGGCTSIEHVVAENFDTEFDIPAPDAPTIADASQEFCVTENANIATLSNLLTAGSLRHYQWYSDAAGTTPLNSTHVLVTGTYYVRNHLTAGSTCRSEALAVAVIINPEVTKVGVEETICAVGGYQVRFTVTGTMPFTVTPSTIVGMDYGHSGTWVDNGDDTYTYTSSVIPYDTPYSLTVSDDKGCGTVLFEGNAPTCYLSIAGTVYNDVNGMTDDLVNGIGIGEVTDADGTTTYPIYANLLDASGDVVATVPVNSNGTYTFANGNDGTTGVVLPNTNYVVQISTNPGVVGAPAPVVDLPENWVHTGENIGSAIGDDGTPDGMIPVSVTNMPVTGVNLAIEELPIAIGKVAPSQINPGGVNTVPVPANIFSGTDTHGGIIEYIIITEFPTNTTSITVNGTTYTSVADFPVGGIKIPTNPAGEPTVSILIDPVDPTTPGDDLVVDIPFWVVDNAGESSLVPSVASMPFEGRKPEISIVKTATTSPDYTDPDTFPEAGEVVTYTFVVTNEGNVPLFGVVLTDEDFDGHGVSPMVPVWKSSNNLTGVAGILQVGEIAEYELQYTLVQADVDQGELNNTAKALGYDRVPGLPDDEFPVEDEDDELVDLPHNPLIEITKAAVFGGDPDRAEVDDEIEYTFVVTNTGNVTLHGITIDDVAEFSGSGDPLTLSTPVGDPAGNSATALAPGATLTYTATYLITQEDIDAGNVTNRALVSGTPPATTTNPTPTPVTDLSDDPDEGADVDPEFDGEPDDPTVVELKQVPTVELTKEGLYTGDPDRAEVGDIIEYTFVVTNTGNVTLTDVLITDDSFSGTGITPLELKDSNGDPVTGPVVSLAPYASLTFTAEYAITQEDINAGEVINQALVQGTPPGTTTPIEDLSDDPNDPTDDDPNTDGNPDDPTVTLLPQDPLVQLEKSSVYTGNPNRAEKGDIIEYTFVVTNTGNVTLYNVEVEETMFTGTGTKPVLSAPVGNPATNTAAELQPYATLTYTATYAITQDDINAGEVVNQAIVRGTPPGTTTPIEDLSDDPNDPTNVDPDGDDNPDDPTVTPLPKDPLIDLKKSAVYHGDVDEAKVGDVIDYTFVLTNTGNVTLKNVRIDDDILFSGTGAKPVLSAPVGNPSFSTESILQPYATLTYTASYAITQEDIDAGEVSNQALASGVPPGTNRPIEDHSDDPNDPTDVDPDGDGNPDDPTVVDLGQNPILELLKDGDWNDVNGDGYAQVGETITYTFRVNNLGNVPVRDLVIDDARLGVVGLAVTPGTLRPGESGTASFVYSIVQSDIDEGGVWNIATVTGKDPKGGDVTDDSEDPTPLDPGDDNYDPDCPDCTVTPLPQHPSYLIVKSADKTEVRKAGEVVTYTLRVTNTGNVTLKNIEVTDILFPDWKGTIESLAPGASSSFELAYTVTQADIDGGKIVNVAVVTGEDPDGTPLDPDEDEHEVPVVHAAGLEVTKTADKSSVKQAGEVITYTIRVKNTGNVTLKNVEVVDPLTGFSQTIQELRVDEERSFTTTYVVNPSDLQQGVIVNIAKAKGEDPDGKEVGDEDREDVPVDACDFKIPNVFTPNGDGINDFFVIEGLDCLDRVEVLIFNRWGNEVYRNDNYRNDWAGLNLNEGVYYYLITSHKGSVRTPHKGWVVLKRN